jgi:hypothetical protein
MPSPYSTGFAAHLQSVNRGDPELLLLEISHVDLPAPIRVVNDTQDLVSGGNLYVAAPFSFTLPDDRAGQPPRAQLVFSNVGRDLMSWLERANGATGALCRVRLVRRSLPNNIELDITVALQSVIADQQLVTANLGYDTLMDRAVIGMRYDPATTPGLY